MAKNKIESKVREVANNRLEGKYNLAQYKEGASKHDEKVRAILHKKVCEEIVAFADIHKDIPFYFILSVGVSKGAYKESEFSKGYKRFNAEEVESVRAMGMEYNKYNGLEGKMTDVTIRLIMRYYEKKSKKMEEFIADLNKSKVLGKACGSRETEYADLCKNLNIPIKEKEEANITAEAA